VVKSIVREMSIGGENCEGSIIPFRSCISKFSRGTGICGIEIELRRDSYWFARLGLIEAKQNTSGWCFTDDDIAALVEPALGAWRLGRRNPSLVCDALGREVFESLFQGLSEFLKGWDYEEEGTINAYVIKQIDITPRRIASIASTLASIGRAYEVVGMTLLKYWRDPSSRITSVSSDAILAEIPVSILVQIRLDGAEKVVAVDILPFSSC
jgi:hypothetical protein